MANRAALTQRWRATCAYEGTGFEGWQSQPNGRTVQDALEARLAVILEHPVRIHGAGRTDAGVHARAQVFHFDAAWAHPVGALQRALRTGLPAGVQVTAIEAARPDFHARFSACGKRYAYRFFEGWALPWETRYCWSLGRRTLDVAAMQAAASRLLGEHDFSAFGAQRGDGSADNPVKRLWRMEVTREGPAVTFTTEGSGYLYKMVRSLAGTLAQVGWGKLTPDEVGAIRTARQRPFSVETAPAHGLWLEEVYYPETALGASEA